VQRLGLADGPHTEQARVDGNHRSTWAKVRPCRRALYSSIAVNVDQPASLTLRASRVRASPDTARSSTYTAWFSRTIVVDSLWSQSRRVFPTRAWQRATFRHERSRRADPFWRRASSRWAVRSFAAALRAMRGASTFRPSTAPRSG
jgi:hypothetical protein